MSGAGADVFCKLAALQKVEINKKAAEFTQRTYW
jgi:hypothetical protein